MGSIYKRGSKLWVAFKDATNTRVCKPTGLDVGQEKQAREMLREIEAVVATGGSPAVLEAEPAATATAIPTVRDYGGTWIDRRKGRVKTWENEEGRLKNHVYPHIGEMLITEVRPKTMRDLVYKLRENRKLAPRTILHVFATVQRLFKSAVIDELITASPAVVEKGVLPKNVDKDPAWRTTAIFTREEMVELISDIRIPQGRRMLHGLKSIAGLRHGEAAGLRWRDYNDAAQPLGKLAISKSYDRAGTKSGISREVPVHPTLAAMLKEWKQSGWPQTFRCMPTPDDLIVPTRNLTARSADSADGDFREDLVMLGLRHRRGHDLRRTFITLAQVDGARRDLLKVITHGPTSGDIMGMYTSFPWASLCAEIEKFKIERNLAPLPRASATEPLHFGSADKGAETSGKVIQFPNAASRKTNVAAGAVIAAALALNPLSATAAATSEAPTVAASSEVTDSPTLSVEDCPNTECLGKRRSIRLSYGISGKTLARGALSPKP
jgi:integrase